MRLDRGTFLRGNGDRFRNGPIFPTVEACEIVRVPSLAEARSTEIPVGTDLSCYGAQVLPKGAYRRTAPASPFDSPWFLATPLRVTSTMVSPRLSSNSFSSESLS